MQLLCSTQEKEKSTMQLLCNTQDKYFASVAVVDALRVKSAELEMSLSDVRRDKMNLTGKLHSRGLIGKVDSSVGTPLGIRYQAMVPSPIAEEFEDASRKTLVNHGADPTTAKSINRTDVFSRFLALEGWDKVRRTYCEFVWIARLQI